MLEIGHSVIDQLCYHYIHKVLIDYVFAGLAIANEMISKYASAFFMRFLFVILINAIILNMGSAHASHNWGHFYPLPL